MECGMYEDDIEEILGYNYWPCVDMNGEHFTAKLYKKNTRGKRKGWRLIKTRSFKTPLEAWDYLRETLREILKFVL